MKKRNQGFTIIELSLAMVFISMLLLAIVMTAIQAGRTYNKGIVLQSVNQSGAHISDMLRRDFLQTNAGLIAAVPKGAADAVIKVQDAGNMVSGRFCLGGYSYLWNTPHAVNSTPTSTQGVVVTTTPGGTEQPINFVRVVDSAAQFCTPLPTGEYPTKIADTDNPTHLLKPQESTDVSLMLYEMNVMRVAQGGSSTETLYAIDFVLGTGETRAINTTNQSCKPPNDAEANDEFCAINKFEMIARTNG